MAEPDVPCSLMIVEDDEILRTRLARAFADRGYEVRQAADADAALEAAREDSPEFVVVDLRMPGRSGIDLIRELVALDPSTRAVVLTGYGSIATALEAVRAGAVDYLTKPADVDRIIAALNRGGRAEEAPAEAWPVPSLARVEWEHINRVLADCGGNLSKAARLLGVHRRSLQRKLAKHPTNR
ncbi:MAG: Fis family DNA-binding response regulator [Acidobacteria bacterium]|nr:Fis family DNA-binding response regulator [Acidobacteriota bacterium]